MVLVFLVFFLVFFPASLGENVLGFADYLVEVFQYENPINRDHFYYVEWIEQNVTFNSNFTFAHYHFDGKVGCVLPVTGYHKLLQNGTIRASDYLPVYHGFHEDMIHNYFSKPNEPEFEGPLFYTAVRKGVHEASLPLWTLDGQPVDSLGHQKYDTVYTTNLEKVLLPDEQNYVAYRRLGYIWPSDLCYRNQLGRDPQNTTVDKNGEETKYSPFTHRILGYLIPLYQFYHEEQKTFYYTNDLNDTNTSRDNYVNVLAYAIDVNHLHDVQGTCGKALVPLYQAYVPGKYSRFELFVGDEKYEEAQRSYGLQFERNTTLGFVALVEGDYCKGRYRLDIVVQNDPPMINPPVNWTAPVGAVPPPYSSSYTLSFNQTFYAW